MIEVVLDFKEVFIEDDVALDLKEMRIKDKFVLYIRKKIGLHYEGLNGNWDGFTDDFREIQYKEFQKYDGWENDERRYLFLKDLNAEYGLTNSDGVRDDLKLIFINFLPFFIKNQKMVMTFLRIFAKIREEAKEYKQETDVLLDMEICIKS